jgi:hypothetical protein
MKKQALLVQPRLAFLCVRYPWLSPSFSLVCSGSMKKQVLLVQPHLAFLCARLLDSGGPSEQADSERGPPAVGYW